MPQIDFTVFFIFALWIFPIFFTTFYYSLVYLFPIFVLWNGIVMCIISLAFLKTFLFIRFKALFDHNYLFSLV